MLSTIACDMHNMNKLAPFMFSLTVIAAAMLAEALLVTYKTSGQQYRSWLLAKCCPSGLDKVHWLRRAFVLPFVFVFPQMVSSIYDFCVREYEDYWTKNRNLIADLNERRTCHFCADCKDMSNTCICMKCNKCSKCKKHVLEKMEELSQMKENARFLRSKSKIITACTENSFMPLIQMTFLFPTIVSFFPKQNVDTSNIIEIVHFAEDNRKFIVTATSIGLSILSMAVSLTELYFTKLGKEKFKTKLRWIIIFTSIILQIVARLMCFQVSDTLKVLPLPPLK